MSSVSKDLESSREFHVSASLGNDSNEGSAAQPLKTIMAAARLAHPGDVITVHAGVYREQITPSRGGESASRRIVYQAAPGERVEIKGSEVVTGWESIGRRAWKTELPESFFGGFNPFADLIHGDWFTPKGRIHHTGAVYVQGVELLESGLLDDIVDPVAPGLWFAEIKDGVTTLWIRLADGSNPNEALVEVNARRSIFYPNHLGVNYLTVRGFVMRHAATPWAPPTAEQVGLIGTHWSKGWIIENNEISHSRCTGVTLGKYGDQYDNTSADTAEGYVETVKRALEQGWSKDRIGGHLVRNNHIHHCEQAGIVGSLGAAFSEVCGNEIHDIHQQQLFDGAEQAGIKFHGAIDTIIAHNRIYRTIRGIWLDWMTQGTRISRNLLHDNDREDLFVEVNHGPFIVDHNLFLSRKNLFDRSEGGAYIHNILAGFLYFFNLPPEQRETPFLTAHTTELAGTKGHPGGDNRFLNNLIVDREGLESYREAVLPVVVEGNSFLAEAPVLDCEDGACSLVLKSDSIGTEQSRLVTTERLGRTAITDLPYESPEGEPLTFDMDYFGKTRNPANPSAGPFKSLEGGAHKIKVWPVNNRANQ